MLGDIYPNHKKDAYVHFKMKNANIKISDTLSLETIQSWT